MVDMQESEVITLKPDISNGDCNNKFHAFHRESSVNAWQENISHKASVPTEITEAKLFTVPGTYPLLSCSTAGPRHAWSEDVAAPSLDEYGEESGISTARTHRSTFRVRKQGKIVEHEKLISYESLHAACVRGDLEAIQSLAAEHGSDVRDVSGFTPLHFAACYGQPKAVELLTRNGANLEAKSVQGWTAAHLAARNGHLECLIMLMDAGWLLRT